MDQGRLHSRRTPTASVASLVDILHLPDTMEHILKELSALDLLKFASTSRACRAAASLSYMQLDINSKAGFKAFRGLHRLGCLRKLQKVDLTAAVSGAEAIGHLTLLGTCPHLRKLRLIFRFDPHKLWWWSYITRQICRARFPAKRASLSELVQNMPIDVMRKIRTYDENYHQDECCCGFYQHSVPKGGSCQVFKNSDKLERCTCHDTSCEFASGMSTSNYRF